MKTQNLLGISALVLVSLGGCTALGAVSSVANVANTYMQMRQAGNRPHGFVQSDFAQLRLGMPEDRMREALGNPTSSSLTPEGWQCHTYSPVLRDGGRVGSATDYTDSFKVLTVDRGDGQRVAGWAASVLNATRPNCEGL